MPYPNGNRVNVQPLPDEGRIKFILADYEYYKTWWRGHFHAIRLIMRGYDLQYIEPDEEVHGV